MTQPTHSPTPLKGYVLPDANEPQGSQSPQAIGTVTQRNAILTHPEFRVDTLLHIHSRYRNMVPCGLHPVLALPTCHVPVYYVQVLATISGPIPPFLSH
jgi:hypothetical protein